MRPRKHHTPEWEGDSVCGSSETHPKHRLQDGGIRLALSSAFAISECAKQEGQSLNHPVD